jgi:hypothetical protein
VECATILTGREGSSTCSLPCWGVAEFGIGRNRCEQKYTELVAPG